MVGRADTGGLAVSAKAVVHLEGVNASVVSSDVGNDELDMLTRRSKNSLGVSADVEG